MATAQEIINDAAKTAGVIDLNNTLDAALNSHFLTLLNQLIWSLFNEGVDIGFLNLTATDEIPLYKQDLLALRYNFALMIMEELGKPISLNFQNRANELKRQLIASYFNVNQAEMPASLKSNKPFNITNG